MAEYEVVREVQNLCGNNQMRDVFFDEIETDDPVEWVRREVKGKQVELRADRAFKPAEYVAAAYDYADFHAMVCHSLNLLRIRVQPLAVDAVTLRSHQGLSREFEQYPLVFHFVTGYSFTPPCGST